ncbi:hypothetical protein [Neolewinella sp.]|uniref:hypothetical protein n=1 Tax=Neolewinella sp. TaxID=2993543 RepID=UPI003B5228D3
MNRLNRIYPLLCLLVLGCLPARAQQSEAVLITPDTSRQHWFGYYDKQQIDPTGRYALGMEVDLFMTSPEVTDTLDIILMDLENGYEKKYIGKSTSWGWQQGCMLQWVPGSQEEVIWNDHEGQDFVSRIYNIRTGEMRVLPRPIYTLDPSGSYALTVDFGRLQYFRPGYGYPSKRPLTVDVKAPTDDGIWKMDLTTGDSELLISYADIASFAAPGPDVTPNYHWFNHLLVNPTGDRFIFLNRSRPVKDGQDMHVYAQENPTWRGPDVKGGSQQYITRAFTADTDGTTIYPLNYSGMFSHFIWLGQDTITAWAMDNAGTRDAFYHFPDRTHEAILIDTTQMPENGHNTFVPGTDYEWVLNDTYPVGEDRMQQLYLYHLPTSTRVDLGAFHEPAMFRGEYRCDLHPRSDRQGQRVFFDSTHRSGKRQMYMIDIRSVVGTN